MRSINTWLLFVFLLHLATTGGEESGGHEIEEVEEEKEAGEMKEDPNMKIVDVNEEDMRGDPRVWLTKAMTEEKAPRPTGKGPKGLARSRHQITYLAHQAKER